MKNPAPMRTIWHSLAWKEWHEHKWKFASVLAILAGIAALVLLDFDSRWLLVGFRVAVVLGMVPLAIFIGLGDAAGERSRGTLPFLQSLPVPMSRVALHKFAFGLITILAPALLTLTVVQLGVHFLASSGILPSLVLDNDPFHWGIGNWLADSSLTLLAVAGSFFIWTVAVGVNRKDEVSAGAVALTVMMGWAVFLLISWFWLTSMVDNPRIMDDSPFNWLAIVGLSTIPGGLISLRDWEENRVYFPLAFTVAAALHIGLASRYIRRFGQISDLEVRSSKAATIGAGSLDWLGPPRRTPFAAIAWKQFRESGPIALVGLAIVVAVVATMLFPNDRPSLGEIYAPVAVTIGFCLAIVIGIGVMLYDVGPGLNTFWRSRPINPDLWFWTKFVSGLTVLLVAIYGPVFLIALLGGQSPTGGATDTEAIVIPLVHITVFAAAVAMTALVRNAVYAAILSIAVMYLGIALVATALQLVYWVGLAAQRPDYLLDVTALQAAVGLLLSFLASTLLAWLAVRHDWGQKSRY